MRNRCQCLLLLASLGLPVMQAALVTAATPAWKTGRDFEFQLSQPASIYWSEVPLRKALSDLAAARKTAVWLDRRCDPEQQISFRANDRLSTCLHAMSQELAALDVAWIDGMVLIGPTAAPNRFATVHQVHRQMVAKLKPALRRRWTREKVMAWPRLTSPPRLVDKIEGEVRVKVLDKDRVLHDLWPENRLPPLPAYTRLGLILAGFDLTFVIDPKDGSAKIVDMPARPRYSAPLPADVVARAKSLITSHPESKLDTSTDPAQLTASWQVHQALQASTPKLDTSPSSAGNVRYSLRVDHQPFGKFAEGLCKQFEIRVAFEEDAKPYLERPISFEVSEVDVPSLIRTMMKAAGLRYELRGGTLRVHGPASE